MRFRVLLAIALLVCLLSCEEDTVNNIIEVCPAGTNKLFNVTVVDANGDPIAGATIAAWTDLSQDFFPAAAAVAPEAPGPSGNSPASAAPQTADGAPALAATVFRLGVQERCDVTLEVYDMNGDPVATLIDGRRNPGVHAVVWTFPQEDVASGVYDCVYTATDTTTGDTLYTANDYAVLYEMADNTFGVTDECGQHATDDKLRFPNLLTLPSLNARAADGTSLGTFTYQDSVTIAVTVEGDSRFYRGRILPGTNSFQLKFSPSAPPSARSATAAIQPEATDQPYAWSFFGPYPNPFN